MNVGCDDCKFSDLGVDDLTGERSPPHKTGGGLGSNPETVRANDLVWQDRERVPNHAEDSVWQDTVKRWLHTAWHGKTLA